MTNRLPKIIIDGVVYYIDQRLSEIRNVDNPHDTESVSPDLIEFWLKNFLKEV